MCAVDVCALNCVGIAQWRKMCLVTLINHRPTARVFLQSCVWVVCFCCEYMQSYTVYGALVCHDTVDVTHSTVRCFLSTSNKEMYNDRLAHLTGRPAINLPSLTLGVSYWLQPLHNPALHRRWQRDTFELMRELCAPVVNHVGSAVNRP